MVPVWLLDIDGVLNAVGGSTVYRGKWPNSVWHETSMVVELEPPWGFADNVGEVQLKVADPVVKLVLWAHENGLAEIRWHTTWQDEAHKLAKWLDLPLFKVHRAPEYFRYEVREDDDLRLDSKNLIICSDDRYGLSPAHLRSIKNYLEKERSNG